MTDTRGTLKLWVGTETLSCDPVMVCAKNQKEALRLLRGTLYQTDKKYFRDLFVSGGTKIERKVCQDLTVPGVWKVERNRMYGLPEKAEDYVPVQRCP